MFIVAHNGARVWGGAERAVALLLHGLQGRGHRVLLLCNDPLVQERARELGVPAEILPIGGDVAIHHAVRFSRRLRELGPDALIVGTFKKLGLAALGAKLASVRPVIARVGLDTDTPRNWKYHQAFRFGVHGVVVNSERIRDAFHGVPGIPRDRVALIHNAVHRPEMRLAPGAVRASLGIPAEARVVGAVARLARQKQFDRLLEAVAMLPSDVHCILAGEGPQRPALEAEAASLGIADRVHFLGYRTDTGDVLAAMDVYAVTSRQEGMSNAMLEALAAGVPVVSTPVSGADEALAPLPDGSAPGVLLSSFESAEIGAALRTLLDDPARRLAMGQAAARVARERFSFDRLLDRWEAVLARGPA